jgi:hypothetical protein
MAGIRNSYFRRTPDTGANILVDGGLTTPG